MRVPWQGGVWCDGQLDRSELWLAGGIVRVRLAVPRLGCLQQDFAVTACNALCQGLCECGRESCCCEDGGNSNAAIFESHVSRLHLVETQQDLYFAV